MVCWTGSVLRQMESLGRQAQCLLDAYFAMIPKAEGNSTPLGQAFSRSSIWSSVRLSNIHGWFHSWALDSVFSAGNGVSSVDARYSTSGDT